MFVEFLTSVKEVSAADWDRCAGDENPFVSHAFLSALETSGVVGPDSGWYPAPAVLRVSASDPILAVVPSYLKGNSKGEYIFDYHWAEAYHQRYPGSSYYPKLQVAIPYTPVPGPRLLVDAGLPAEQQRALRRALLQGLFTYTEQNAFSSCHLTFGTHQEQQEAAQLGFLPRLGEQYHWFNESYQSFDDYLSTLTSRKRKAIRRERERANLHPLTICTVSGESISEAELLRFYRCYQKTCFEKWGDPYLNLDFFQTLSAGLRDKLVYFLVKRDSDGEVVAGAWNLRGRNALFGRNWGCTEHYDLLHFEVCYYRAIEYAIQHGLQRVEAGAQGMHKIQRGYRPRPVYSAHYIVNPEFRRAIAQYLSQERAETRFRLEALQDLQPFKAP